MRRRGTFVFFAAALTAACSGGNDSTSPGGNGFVQIASYVFNPQSVQCGVTINPVRETGSPDSVALQVTLVNSTRNDVTLVSGGSYGTVIRSSDATDVGKTAMTYEVLPYRSTTATVPALHGEVVFTFMLPTIPFCQSKPIGYDGYQDVSMTARLTASSGQYVTGPLLIHVVWIPPV